MKTVPYSHQALLRPLKTPTGDFQVYLAETPVPNCPDPLRHALDTMRLAVTLGVRKPSRHKDPLPYSEDTDTLVFPAPLASMVCGRRMFFLRGWRQFGGCVKGFNALGLLAEHASLEVQALKALSPAALRQARLEFLGSRQAVGEPGRPAFTQAELAALSDAELGGLDPFSLALWRAFAKRTVVCSTSSNMGISLHEALRYMQRRELGLGGKRFPLLNQDEGELIIWCPDEKADFMNPEKTAYLRALESEKPKLTTLHTYINRLQRDPGALKDALNSGGYFYPTNPQSREEMQNLLTISLLEIAGERNIPFDELFIDPNIRTALASLGARIEGDRVAVRSAVEGGMLGLAVPYLILLEETLLREDSGAVCAWNPASIGAALAALVLCDMTLRRGPKAAEALEPDLSEFFPRLGAFLRRRRLGRDLPTRIHGIFDIANLQSLAQLFGVVVTRHLSGRATAYVGLGSSSYANGNLCFDTLRESADSKGAFGGRDSLHPATHSVNPLAQALVYAEDLRRISALPGFDSLDAQARTAKVRKHCRKPEPAGAAALAGYILTRLDAGTLSFIEIAYALRAGGFTRETFLEFANFGKDEGAVNRCIQLSSEEGEYMESLVRSVLETMSWEFDRLRLAARSERAQSRLEYRWNALDDDAFESRNPAVNINLTGDNCAQPSAGLVAELIKERKLRAAALEEDLAEDGALQAKGYGFDAVTAVKTASGTLSWLLGNAQKGLDTVVRGAVRPMVNRMALRTQAPGTPAQPRS